MRYFYNVEYQLVISETDKAFNAQNKFQFGLIELDGDYDFDDLLCNIKQSLAKNHEASPERIRNLNLLAFNRA